MKYSLKSPQLNDQSLVLSKYDYFVQTVEFEQYVRLLWYYMLADIFWKGRFIDFDSLKLFWILLKEEFYLIIQ